MNTSLSEDDIYRASTQYRFWNFSPAKLAAQRRTTHDLALQRARQYAGQNEADGDRGEVEYLTEEEELRLVQRYCNLIRTTSDHLQWPPNVKATAIQYLKRFYLSNSCMTYPPKDIYKTALYLASKTEAIHSTVTKYAHRISADPEAILAPEYKLMQALRFTLEVRHPSRGLKGVLMELLNMAEGRSTAATGASTETGDQLVARLKGLAPPQRSAKSPWQAPADGSAPTAKQLTERIQFAYSAARDLLDAPANLTDVYFLYTPSQILLAAMRLADDPLLDFYMQTKPGPDSATASKILATITACATEMGTFDAKNIMSKDEGRELEKKLERCRDPTTADLLKSHAAAKRNGAEDGKLDDEDAKRRKLERLKNDQEMNDMFGPDLSVAKAKG